MQVLNSTNMMDKLIESSTTQGYKMTPKRQQIIESLWCKSEIHDIEELWLAVRDRNNVSWATFQTTIKLLYRLGWLELNKNETKKRKYHWTNGKRN